MSHYKQELVCLYIGILDSLLDTQIQRTHFAFNLFITDKPSDDDDKPDMGPSTSTRSKSATVSEVTQTSLYMYIQSGRRHISSDTKYWLHISLCTLIKCWYCYKIMCGHNVWTFWDMTHMNCFMLSGALQPTTSLNWIVLFCSYLC